MTGDWIVLRCAGASTLRLADSLAAAGLEAWTPREILRKRKPGRTRHRDTAPVMPTYVFARARNLHTLLAESQAFVSPHPDFSVFRYFGEIPLIADRTLDPLRVAERKGQSIDSLIRFEKGDAVRYPEAGFEGLSGRVVQLRSKGRLALVAFGSLQVEIATMLLLEENPQPQPKAA